jgi:hypothetical protein
MIDDKAAGGGCRERRFFRGQGEGAEAIQRVALHPPSEQPAYALFGFVPENELSS